MLGDGSLLGPRKPGTNTFDLSINCFQPIRIMTSLPINLTINGLQLDPGDFLEISTFRRETYIRASGRTSYSFIPLYIPTRSFLMIRLHTTSKIHPRAYALQFTQVRNNSYNKNPFSLASIDHHLSDIHSGLSQRIIQIENLTRTTNSQNINKPYWFNGLLDRYTSESIINGVILGISILNLFLLVCKITCCCRKNSTKTKTYPLRTYTIGKYSNSLKGAVASSIVATTNAFNYSDHHINLRISRDPSSIPWSFIILIMSCSILVLVWILATLFFFLCQSYREKIKKLFATPLFVSQSYDTKGRKPIVNPRTHKRSLMIVLLKTIVQITLFGLFIVYAEGTHTFNIKEGIFQPIPDDLPSHYSYEPRPKWDAISYDQLWNEPAANHTYQSPQVVWSNLFGYVICERQTFTQRYYPKHEYWQDIALMERECLCT